MSINKECRICFEKELDNKFISPCLCDGTSKYIHKKCLKKWRMLAENKIAKKKCMECNAFYKIKKKYILENFFIDFLTFDINDYEKNRKMIFDFFYINLLIADITLISFLFSLENRIIFFNDKIFFNKNLNRNESEYFMINYAFWSFLLLLFSFLYFLKKINKKIRRKNVYYCLIAPPLIANFILSFHYIFFYLFIGFIGEAYCTYVYLEFLCSLFNCFFFSNIFYCHNNILKYMNEDLNPDIICNFIVLKEDIIEPRNIIINIS
jgi:hypothetical protein